MKYALEGTKSPDLEEIPLKPEENNINNNENNIDIKNNQKQNFQFIINNPRRDEENHIDIRADYIWEGFPLSERFWYSFCCKTKCCSDFKNGDVFTTQCFREKCNIDKKLNNLDNKILTLSILKSGTLEIMPMIMHPFVRISIVNLKTGKYIQKSDFGAPAICRNENNFTVKHDLNTNHLELSTSLLDMIPPFATCPYDLREKGESYAEWNEDFYINEKASTLLDDNIIFFFEILDYNLNYNLNPKEDCIIPMAWGYLKPVGFSQTYMGKHKIQLYKYKFNRTNKLSDYKKKNHNFIRTPDLLYELDWIKKEKYQTFLQICLGLEDFPTKQQLQNVFFINKYIYSVFVDESEEVDIVVRPPTPEDKPIKQDTSLEDKLRKWRRGNDKCIIPDMLLYKFQTAKLGCLTHEFSHNGKYIAAACTEINSETHIKIFNVEEGKLRYIFKGHHNIIHHFTWSFDDLILISSSADNVVTLWRIPKHETSEKENLNPMENYIKFKIKDIHHPAYVYSTDIFPKSTKETMILATACFDGLVRIYIIKFNYDNQNIRYNFQNSSLFFEIPISQEFEDKAYFQKIESQLKDGNVQKKDKERLSLLQKTALDHRHPNTVVFDITGRLYIGDSLGHIHIWLLSIDRDYPKMEKIKIISHKELEYGTINKITIIPKQSQRLIVHTRDNCIRLIDISTEKTKIILRYFGLKCCKTNIKSTCSPDGSYLLSGSEEGVPKMWQLETGIPFSTNKYECGFIDSVNDVSWNNIYNMNALSGFGQEYPLLVYVHERKDQANIEETNNLIINEENKKSQVFKPMIEDTNDLIGEEKAFNDKYNSNNNFNNNINNINTSNYNEGIDDEVHNTLPQDYFLPKSTNQK
jgi:jouberin